MATAHSPSIATDGLIYYHDMNNNHKSWKGAPTTNLVVTTPYTLTTYNACTGPVDTLANDTDMQSRTVNRYTVTATGVTPRGRIIATGLSAGVDYSFSCKLKYNGGIIPSWYIDSSKGNPEGGVNNNTFTTHTTSYIPIGNGWYQFTEKFNFATCLTGGSFSNFGFAAPTADFLNQTFDVYDIQFEQNTFATPFVNGTRLNTQAIIDLTGINTTTATSLTYNTDGSASFDGSSNYIDVTNNLGVLSSYTFCHWSRRDAEGRVPLGWRAGPMFYQYGDSSWYYTHGGVGAEYSYPKAVSIPAGTWGFYCITYDGTNVKIYRNGKFEGQQASTGTADWTNGLRIGFWAGAAGYYYQGAISTVGMYNRALSASEVQQNFNALRGRYGI